MEKNDALIKTKNLSHRITPKKGFQMATFEIPIPEEDTLLNKLRLDISAYNKNQAPITINSISFKTSESKLYFKENIRETFKPNNYLSYKNGKYHTKSINGKYDPFLVFDNNSKILQKLTAKQSKYSVTTCILIAVACCYIFFFCFNSPKVQSHFNITNVAIITFCLFLYTPTILKFSQIKETTKLIENRKLSKKPTFELSKSYFSSFETYYNDHFPFRNMVTKWMSAIKINLFKSSPFPDKAKFGKEKFIFLNNKQVLPSYTNSNLLSEIEINKAVKTILDRKKEINAKGIKYFIGFFPNKHTIYGEYLPFSMQQQINGNITQADQLVEALAKNGITFFDVRDEMMQAKSKKLLYQKLDTHWNHEGAFVAYQTFFEKNKALGVKPFKYDDFEIKIKKRNWGDLTKTLGVDKITGYEENRPIFTLKDKSKNYKKVDSKDLTKLGIRTINKNCNNEKKLMVFGDSYTHWYLPQFISLHFREVIYLRNEVDQKIIDQLQPDIVIEFTLERNIYQHIR